MILLLQPINETIAKQLALRGFKSLGSSNTRKKVQAFEQSNLSRDVFETLRNHPFLITLLHLVAQQNKPVTKDQVQQVLKDYSKRLEEVLQKSPDKNLLCRNCKAIVQKYNEYEENRPTRTQRCPKCNAQNDLSKIKEESDWSFPLISVTSYLDELVSKRILSSKVLGSCTRCTTSAAFDQIPLKDINELAERELRKYVKNIYCQQCGRFYDLTELYYLSDLISPLWNNDGTWLEWYVKSLLRKDYNDCPVEQGIIIKKDETVEADVILLSKDKLISFECKALGEKRSANFNEVSDVLKLLGFSDEVFLITTTTLKENDKKSLLKIGEGKLNIIEGNRTQEISHYLN